MDMLITAAAGGVLGGLLVATGVMTYRLWRAGMRQKGSLLMHRVLEREGVSLEGCADEAVLARTSAAARGCLLCRDQATCLAWLEGDAPVSLQQFCPNAEMIADLRSARRTCTTS
jgi:hypothetical protein